MKKIKILKVAAPCLTALALVLFSKAMVASDEYRPVPTSQETCLEPEYPEQNGNYRIIDGENCWEWVPFYGWGLLGKEASCHYTPDYYSTCLEVICKTWWTDDIKCYKGTLPPADTAEDTVYPDTSGLNH